MTLIALDGFGGRVGHALPPIAQQHLDAFAAQEAYTALTFRAGEREADYLVVRGCEGCRSGTCVIGCRAMLLRRAFEHALPGLRTRVVNVPLLKQSFSAGVLAWPGRGAASLDRSLLALRPTVLVAQHVQRRGTTLRVGAGVMIEETAAGERVKLVGRLRADGWRVIRVPRPLVTGAAQMLERGALWWGSALVGDAPLLVGSVAGTAAASLVEAPDPAFGVTMGEAFGREEAV